MHSKVKNQCKIKIKPRLCNHDLSSLTKLHSLFWSVSHLKQVTSMRPCRFFNRIWAKCLMNMIGVDWRLNKFKSKILAKNLQRTIKYWKRPYLLCTIGLKTKAMNLKRAKSSLRPKISKLEPYKLVSSNNNPCLQARRCNNNSSSCRYFQQINKTRSQILSKIPHYKCKFMKTAIRGLLSLKWINRATLIWQRDLCSLNCNSINNSLMEL